MNEEVCGVIRCFVFYLTSKAGLFVNHAVTCFGGVTLWV